MINIKKIQPLFTSVITTMDKYEQDVKVGNLIDANKQQGCLKEYQRVIAVGDTVKNIKEGDLVHINPIRYAVKQHREGSLKDGIVTDNPVVSYNFDLVTIDNKDYLLLQDRDINFIIKEWEDILDPNNLIMPEDKKIIC